MHPFLNFKPSDYIIPLLHLLIGIVNKSWSLLLFFLNEFVEEISDLEAELKDEMCGD